MTAFILDTYNKYQSNENCRLTFNINSNQYCIREVELEWGQPIFPEKPWENEGIQWKIFNTLEEAKEAVQKLKKLNS